MKTLVYFSLLVLLVGVGGCKKGAYRFEGKYHMVGAWRGPSDSVYTITATSATTLFFYNEAYDFLSKDDYYTYQSEFYQGPNTATLSFKGDSAFYYKEPGGHNPLSYPDILTGVKVH